jgi:short-chain Z-isoprenyl diphosphate synthase
MTSTYDQYYLNIGVAYGGREEIVDAVRGLLESYDRQGMCLKEVASRVSVAEIESHLYLKGIPDPDLIIRTSGEVRLSGFLLWQSVYSEFYFCDVYWPAFRKLDLLRAIRSFQQRKRRFGR